MKAWTIDFDLARVSEAYGIAILTAGIIMLVTGTSRQSLGIGFIISGTIFVAVVSTLFRKRGESKQDSLEIALKKKKK